MLRFFEIEGRSPGRPGELPSVAVDFVGRRLCVPATGLEVTGRAVEAFRVSIRDVLGFRVFSRDDRAPGVVVAGGRLPQPLTAADRVEVDAVGVVAGSLLRLA